MRNLFHQNSAKLQNRNAKFVFIEDRYDLESFGNNREPKKSPDNWNPLAILEKGDQAETEKKKRKLDAEFAKKAKNFERMKSDDVFDFVCAHIDKQNQLLGKETPANVPKLPIDNEVTYEGTSPLVEKVANSVFKVIGVPPRKF